MAKKTQQTFEVTITNNGSTGLDFNDLFKVRRRRPIDNIKLVKTKIINVPTPVSKIPKNTWIQGFGKLLKKSLVDRGYVSCKSYDDVRSTGNGFKLIRFNSGVINVVLHPTKTYKYCKSIRISLSDNKATFRLPVSYQENDWLGNMHNVVRWENKEISLSDPDCVLKVFEEITK